MFKEVLCLMGPTATGKTELAIKLASLLPIEIISVDSALVYKGMDIGTSKPSPQVLQEIPHHLINIKEVSEIYSAAEFRNNALILIKNIQKAGKIPLLVGGTMLYFKALLHGLDNLPSSDPKVRSALQADLELHGSNYLHEKLKQIDIKSAERIHPNDPQRILRALEVYQITGKPLSEQFFLNQQKSLPFRAIQIALIPNCRQTLHKRIEQRTKQMFEQGFLDEVRALHARSDIHADLPSMKSVGYRQAMLYLNGKISCTELKESVIIATRQLAKRQLTWLRHWPELHYFDYAVKGLPQIILRSIDKIKSTK
ncbi:MAG: tRNA (adenosine(37)-N6)-dimethylallyltransferase MiaA [Gammaproteobacteria bacterium]